MTDQPAPRFRPPLTGALTISQTFDEHIAYGIEKGYKNYNPAIDYAVPLNTPVYAACQGLVTWVEYHNPGYGHMILIDHEDGFQSLYAHLDYILVTAGQPVDMGQLIARTGNTGRSTGPHLHFEMRKSGTPIDPAPLLLSKASPPGPILPGSTVSALDFTYLRSSPAVKDNNALAICNPATALTVESVLTDLGGNQWLKVQCYICQTYKGAHLVSPIS